MSKRIPYAVRFEGEIVVMADKDASEDEVIDEAWAAIRKSSHVDRLIEQVAVVRRHGVAPHRWFPIRRQ